VLESTDRAPSAFRVRAWYRYDVLGVSPVSVNVLPPGTLPTWTKVPPVVPGARRISYVKGHPGAPVTAHVKVTDVDPTVCAVRLPGAGGGVRMQPLVVVATTVADVPQTSPVGMILPWTWYRNVVPDARP